MEFLDSALVKAKEVFDVACKKTNEVVSSGKQKFDVASIESKRSKDFEKLGKLYFNMIRFYNKITRIQKLKNIKYLSLIWSWLK